MTGKSGSRYQQTIGKGTFFDGGRKSISEMLQILYHYFANNWNTLDVTYGFSSGTQSNYGDIILTFYNIKSILGPWTEVDPKRANK